MVNKVKMTKMTKLFSGFNIHDMRWVSYFKNSHTTTVLIKRYPSVDLNVETIETIETIGTNKAPKVESTANNKERPSVNMNQTKKKPFLVLSVRCFHTSSLFANVGSTSFKKSWSSGYRSIGNMISSMFIKPNILVNIQTFQNEVFCDK